MSSDVSLRRSTQKTVQSLSIWKKKEKKMNWLNLPDVSKAFSLDLTDAKKIIANAVLVGSAAALTAVADNLGNLHLGPYTPLVVTIVSPILMSAIQFIKSGQTPEQK
jgi:hypothetical protein